MLYAGAFAQFDKFCNKLVGDDAGMFGLPLADEFTQKPLADFLNTDGFIRMINAAVKTRDGDPKDLQQLEQNRLRKELEEKLK